MTIDSEFANALRVLTTNSALIERMSLAGASGRLYAGARDIFEAAGYATVLDFDALYDAYKRQEIAKRIVRAAADETWRLPPEILDGDDLDSAKEDGVFVDAVRQLAVGTKTGAADSMPGLWHYVSRVDRISGIGRYGVMLLGVRDSKAFVEPLEPAKRKPEDLLYISVFHEGTAKVDEWVADKTDPRYGRPLFYSLTLGSDENAARTERVHWTRCIHIAEDLEDDDTFGTPRLEACWNRIVDILKIMAGAGEAAWKLLDTGHIISTKEGARLPTKEGDLIALEDQIDEFVNGLRRWLLAEGLDASRLEGSVQDPSGLVMTNIALISAATGIPQRILLGSERGELASSQDEGNWAKQIETRQSAYAGPLIVRPLLNRLIYAGILPMPTSGHFAIRWPALVETDRMRDATIATTIADALTKIGANVDAKEFAKALLPDVPDEAIKEPEPVPAQLLPPVGAVPGLNGQPGQPGQGKGQAGTQAAQNGQEAGNGGEPVTNAGRFRGPVWWVAGEEQPVRYP